MQWWFSIVLVISACGKDAAPVASPLVEKTRTLADRMCACHDAVCAKRIDEAWNALAHEQASATLSADEVDALAADTVRYTKCLGELHP